MDVSIEAFRNRIGQFRMTRHIGYIPSIKRKIYKPSTEPTYKVRRIYTLFILLISISSSVNLYPESEPTTFANSQVSVHIFKARPLRQLGGPCACAVEVVHGGPVQDRGWIPAAVPLQY